jgi:hypothetical protein
VIRVFSTYISSTPKLTWAFGSSGTRASIGGPTDLVPTVISTWAVGIDPTGSVWKFAEQRSRADLRLSIWGTFPVLVATVGIISRTAKRFVHSSLADGIDGITALLWNFQPRGAGNSLAVLTKIFTNGGILKRAVQFTIVISIRTLGSFNPNRGRALFRISGTNRVSTVLFESAKKLSFARTRRTSLIQIITAVSRSTEIFSWAFESAGFGSVSTLIRLFERRRTILLIITTNTRGKASDTSTTASSIHV